MPKMSVAELRSRASHILPHASINDVRVNELSIKSEHPVIAGPYDVETDIAAKGSQRGPAIDCYMRYRVRATVEDAEHEAWSADLMMVGTWTLEPDDVKFEEQDVASFALAIGSMTLHPYARECIQNAVSRLGYPPFTLDMLPALTGGEDDDILEFEAEEDSNDREPES